MPKRKREYGYLPPWIDILKESLQENDFEVHDVVKDGLESEYIPFFKNGKRYTIMFEQPEDCCYTMNIKNKDGDVIDRLINIPSLHLSQKRWNQVEEMIYDFIRWFSDNLNP